MNEVREVRRGKIVDSLEGVEEYFKINSELLIGRQRRCCSASR